MPEESEEALHLVKGDHLGEQSHDPVLAEDEDIDLAVLEMPGEVREFLVDEDSDDFTVHVETWESAHVDFFEMVVVKEA